MCILSLNIRIMFKQRFQGKRVTLSLQLRINVAYLLRNIIFRLKNKVCKMNEVADNY